MRITPTSGLAPNEIEQLIREAADFADSDREAKEMVVMRNKLESLLRNTQKSFTQFGGLLLAKHQDLAQRVFSEGVAALKTDSLDEINKALNGLEQTAGQLTAAMMDPTKNNTSKSAEEPR